MSILDDIAKEASTQFDRARATLLGGSGTNTPAPAPQKAAILSPQAPDYAQANKIEQLAQRSGATDAAFAKAQQASRPTYSAPSAGANPNVPPGGSAEAQAYRASQAAEAGPRSIAGEAAAPRNVPLNATLQKGIDAAKSTFSAQMPSLPSGDGVIARGARYLGNAGMGALKTVARVAEPVIEGARVAQVAMDPTMTKADVAQQAAEGVTRWGATAGGAALGAGLGAMTGPAAPVASPVLAVAGGVAGYMGGDELVSKVRSMVGLGDKSPAQRSSERIAAASPVAQAAAAAPKQPSNVVDGANGSKVQMNTDGSAQLVQRPTEPAAAAPAPAQKAPSGARGGATGAPTIAGEAKAAAKPKAAPKAAKSPVAAAADPAPDTAGIDKQLAELTAQRDALGLKADYMQMGGGSKAPAGVANPAIFTDKDGSRFAGFKLGDEQRGVLERTSILPGQGDPGTVFEKDGKQYINHAVGTDEVGKPLVKAYSVDGKADVTRDQALMLSQRRADTERDFGTHIMSPEQEKRVSAYMALDQKIRELEAQKPWDGYGLTQGGQSYWVDGKSGVAVPALVHQQGKSQQYIDEVAKAQLRGADPMESNVELAKQKIANEGRLAEANVKGGFDLKQQGIASAASRYGHDRQFEASKYKTDTEAGSAKKNIILQDETVDDGMGGTKVVKRAYHADGTPVGVTQQGTGGGGFQNGQVYQDPKTGARARYNNGKWEPIK